ncbi:MAG: sigma-54-dependent Fis family transcriptional regulator [Gemmatimonadetes bacterium]|nr:MAG: sigma-54-dependent Fis family transcriptional regulator [Gemmatimonadota bacterium]
MESKTLQQIIGESPAIKHVLRTVKQVAPTNATVLIVGESGTGKELIARALHELSPRADRPFIAINCGAIAEGVLESELFGHERGAFTGAHALRKGKFELADQGTIFLDEIGEMDLSTQVRLLRVLEEQEFMRVGGSQNIQVDTRVIAATNRDLTHDAKTGVFRQDLYYRLKVVTIEVPPLRERRSDIPLLIDAFIKRFCAEHNTHFVGISDNAMDVLMEYDWPGNIRELRNFVESMVVLSPHQTVREADLPEYMRLPKVNAPPQTMLVPRESLLPQVSSNQAVDVQLQSLMPVLWLKGLLEKIATDISELKEIAHTIAQHTPPEYDKKEDLETLEVKLGMSLQEVEQEMIRRALEATNGHRRKAAELLDISERTLYRKIKEYGLDS